jgi:hypothetical protein
MAGQRLIICNTSPLINFAETGCLDLLTGLPGTVVAALAVRDVLRAKAGLFPHAAELADSVLLATLAPADTLPARSFAATLHPGEAECLALAMERPGSLLVLDDLSARAAANGLPFTGTLGILAQAKATGRLPALAPLLYALKTRARFWIHPRLEQSLLREAGE